MIYSKRIFLSLMIAVTCLVAMETANAQTISHKRHTTEQKAVKVFFYHESEGQMDALAPVTRQVSATAPARAAIEALLQGPTKEERAKGFDGLASAWEFRIGSLNIRRGTARINFLVRQDWQGFPGDIAPGQFKSAVELTLKQFPGVRRVVVSLNGDLGFAE